MPHVSIEFSKSIELTTDIQSICDGVFEALASQNAFPNAKVIKVRASAVDYLRLGCDPQTFAHATLSLMAGRDEPTRKHLNSVILDVLIKGLPDVQSLTVQEIEMNSTTYAQRTL